MKPFHFRWRGILNLPTDSQRAALSHATHVNLQNVTAIKRWTHRERSQQTQQLVKRTFFYFRLYLCCCQAPPLPLMSARMMHVTCASDEILTRQSRRERTVYVYLSHLLSGTHTSNRTCMTERLQVYNVPIELGRCWDWVGEWNDTKVQ